MKRVIICIGMFVQLCGFGVKVKAAGFNEVPWVAYTIVDAAEPYYDSMSGQSGYSKYKVSVNLPDSMENYFVMHTYAYGYHNGGHGKGPIPSTTIEAGVTKTNFSVTAPFTIKIFSYGRADLYHWTSSQMNNGAAISQANILLCIDGAWGAVWTDYYLDPFIAPGYPHPTHYYAGNMSFPRASGNLTGIKINGISFVCTAGSGYHFCEAGATNDFRIDSIIIDNVGVEEKQLPVVSGEWSVNIKTRKDKIYLDVAKSVNAELKIYDLCGRLKETVYQGTLGKGNYEFTANVRKNGIYFVRLKSDEYNITRKLILMK